MALLGWLQLVQKYFTSSQDSQCSGEAFLALENDLVDPLETQRGVLAQHRSCVLHSTSNN